MSYSARLIVTSSKHFYCCFVYLDLESGDGRTDRRTTTCAKTMIPRGRDFGLAEWFNSGLLNMHDSMLIYKLIYFFTDMVTKYPL